mgnify:CR=1 FL=1
MIDLHAHILPGIDDGVENYEEAITTARCAMELGINCIVATPHCNPEMSYKEREFVLEQVKLLQDALCRHNVELKLLAGAEYSLGPELPQRLVQGDLITLNDRGEYLLVELPQQY